MLTKNVEACVMIMKYEPGGSIAIERIILPACSDSNKTISISCHIGMEGYNRKQLN